MGLRMNDTTQMHRRRFVFPKLTVTFRPQQALWAGSCVLLVAALVFGDRYWTVGRFIESTDDAYVKADSTTVSPKVSGYIAEVLVQDNQPVAQGQVLARIDDAICKRHCTKRMRVSLQQLRPWPISVLN
jgi:multidrug resistance efflux pump